MEVRDSPSSSSSSRKWLRDPLEAKTPQLRALSPTTTPASTNDSMDISKNIRWCGSILAAAPEVIPSQNPQSKP